MNSPLARAQNTILVWQKKCDAKDREIDRLTACVEHHQAVEADQERAIERLQSELGVWKANAETNLGEVERLQAAIEGLRQNRDLAYEKEKRLRSALERIEDMAEPYIASIAREALRDE